MTDKLFTAIDGKGRNIITVFAQDETQAKAEVSKELHKNVSRYPYLKQWAKSNFTVVEKIRETAHIITISDNGTSLTQRVEKTRLYCLECDRQFSRVIKSSTIEVKCPGCGGYDIELA